MLNSLESLQTICRTMLDDASLWIEFINFPFGVRLTFYVTGTDKKVIFLCSQIEKFSLNKGAFDEPEYVCLEVNVEQPEKERPRELSDFEFELMDKKDFTWSIEVLPEAEIKIKCLQFEWELLTMTQKEMDERNNAK